MAWRGRIAAVIGGLALLGAGALVLADLLQIARTEPPLVAEPECADRVLVEKAARRLTLLREGRTMLYPLDYASSSPEGRRPPFGAMLYARVDGGTPIETGP